MKEAYKVDKQPINKKVYKKNFSKKRKNGITTISLILKIIEIGVLIAIWCELFFK